MDITLGEVENLENNNLIAIFVGMVLKPHHKWNNANWVFELNQEELETRLDRASLPFKIVVEEYKYLYSTTGTSETLGSKNLKFHSEWNWLMPVVEKIEQVNGGAPKQLLHLTIYNTKEEIYLAVVDFIKAYNEEYGIDVFGQFHTNPYEFNQ